MCLRMSCWRKGELLRLRHADLLSSASIATIIGMSAAGILDYSHCIALLMPLTWHWRGYASFPTSLTVSL